MSAQLSRAAQWWLHSGIQDSSGGVARYYRLDLEQNNPISTEITGYAASTFVYLHAVSGEREFLERARRAACFLSGAWDGANAALPFELEPAGATYFFDCGIVVRGLLAAWRALDASQFRNRAVEIGAAMLRDFASDDGGFHPILSLPDKRPAERDKLRWSRSPGCYQLKSAMAWHGLARATGDARFQSAYETAVEGAMASREEFLPGHSDPTKVMDRLHAYAYFLEGLLPLAGEPDCKRALAEGIGKIAALLRRIGPEFERSDVYAQLLRLRLYADFAGACKMDLASARWEAERLTEFQADSEDKRLAGGYYFGKRQGQPMPFVNPVSTSFALQSLALWNDFPGESVEIRPDCDLLI